MDGRTRTGAGEVVGAGDAFREIEIDTSRRAATGPFKKVESHSRLPQYEMFPKCARLVRTGGGPESDGHLGGGGVTKRDIIVVRVRWL